MIEANAVVDRLRRTTDTIVGEADLLERLESGRPLRIKYGVDPTAPRVTDDPAGPSRTRSLDGGRDSERGEVIVLDQDGVRQRLAMVEAAAGAHGCLLRGA